ncbi:hypothetical protein WA577_006604 [Blastocystis sp. JDR]
MSEVYWVKVNELPWWPALVVPCDHVALATASGEKQTSFDPTDKTVKATLLAIDKECLFPSKGSFLRFSDHSFSAEDVDESLRDQFVEAVKAGEEIVRNTQMQAPSPVKLTRANSKRNDYISWDEYFMGLACLSAMRSKDPNTQVGACIVNSFNQIVGIGYNGFPRGCSDDVLPWGREGSSELDTKYMYVCHAEMNAILNINTANARGCKLYVSLFPCNNCCKMIIQSGITEVVYLDDKYHDSNMSIAARRMFDMAGVKYTRYQGKRESIVIRMSP